MVLAIIDEADFTVIVFNKGSFNAILPKKCFPAFVLAKYLTPNTIAIITGIIINQ